MTVRSNTYILSENLKERYHLADEDIDARM